VTPAGLVAQRPRIAADLDEFKQAGDEVRQAQATTLLLVIDRVLARDPAAAGVCAGCGAALVVAHRAGCPTGNGSP
jgi:hypothetical protein